MDDITLADELEALIAAATKGDLSTAEHHTDGKVYECPVCGDGEVDAADYCNFDSVALGVQFYGIGNEFGAHEKLWRWFTEHRDTILAALRTPAPAPVAVAVGGDVVEGMAKAIYEEDDPWHTVWPWPNLKECGNSDTYRRLARAALQAQPTASTAQPDDVVERVKAAIMLESDRWHCFTGGEGIDDVITRDDDGGEPQEMARHPQGDGYMHFWDMRGEAIARAALAAMQQAPVADDVAKMLERLDNEQSLCRNDGADDIAALLGEAQTLIKGLTQPQPDAAVAVEQWQPIETAPKDGSRFLVWEKHYGIRIGRCKERADHDDWLSYMDAFDGSSKGGPRATHWMPLPTPPAAIRAGGQQS